MYRHGDSWLHLSVAEPAPAKQEGAGRVAGADPGEVHALAPSTGDRHLVRKKLARCQTNSRRRARSMPRDETPRSPARPAAGGAGSLHPG